MVFKHSAQYFMGDIVFENDVKIYGIQTAHASSSTLVLFENDVKIYGIQTITPGTYKVQWFENDVKIYGIQTHLRRF